MKFAQLSGMFTKSAICKSIRTHHLGSRICHPPSRAMHTSLPQFRVYESVLETIGNTPIIKANNVLSDKARSRGVNLYAKAEYFNPLASVKDRMSMAIINMAEREGVLKPGMTVVEATSGNTGISLAMVCAKKGYPFVAVMADSFSIDRRKIMRALGAKVVLTPSSLFGKGMVDKARELAKAHGWFWAQQFENKANAPCHSCTTGAEILQDFAFRRLDYWVTGYGSGGTFTGVAKVLKCARPEVKVVLVEPTDAPLVKSGIKQNRFDDATPSASHPNYTPHLVQGWVPSFIPWVCQQGVDLNLYDMLETVTNEDAMEMTKRLATSEGLFAGISGGATTFAAAKIAEDAPDESVILTMLPDTQERYQSSALFATISAEMNEEEIAISKSTPFAQFPPAEM